MQQLHGDQLETFEELPKRLQLEISKPSHIPELKEKVLDGDIKTHKEYKELERKLKQRDEQNAQLQSQVEQAHLTTKTLFHMWLNSMYTRTVVLYLHNMISTINNSITKACTGTIYHNIKLSVIVILIVFSYVTIIFSFSVWFS